MSTNSGELLTMFAGVMLADSPYRHELEADVEPFPQGLLERGAVALVGKVRIVLEFWQACA